MQARGVKKCRAVLRQHGAVHNNGVIKGLAQKGPIFDTRGFPVALIRLAIQSPLHQRRVLARCRCGEALGRRTRRQTMMPSSDAALAKSSAATAVRTEFASQRSSLLQTSGCRRRHMVRTNHAGNGGCFGAARRAAGAFEALPRLLQQHAAHAVLEAPWPKS